MSTGYVERSVALFGCKVSGLELAPHAIRLLADGEPVALERLAAAVARPVEDIEVALGEQTSAERDDQGRLVGLGLTLRPTAHRFTLAGRTLYAWCASDVLMFPVILGQAGVGESPCPHTGRTIRLELTPDTVARVDPPIAVVSAVRPAACPADVRSAICQHGHFFSSPDAAAPWLAEHRDGEIRPVDEAFHLDRQVVAQLGWDPPQAHAANGGWR